MAPVVRRFALYSLLLAALVAAAWQISRLPGFNAGAVLPATAAVAALAIAGIVVEIDRDVNIRLYPAERPTICALSVLAAALIVGEVHVLNVGTGTTYVLPAWAGEAWVITVAISLSFMVGSGWEAFLREKIDYVVDLGY